MAYPDDLEEELGFDAVLRHAHHQTSLISSLRKDRKENVENGLDEVGCLLGGPLFGAPATSPYPISHIISTLPVVSHAHTHRLL